MSLIVQKFGGSSVANAERVNNVARIVTDTYKKGNKVVVVVSAQGDTTDDLIEKAAEINPNPSKREMDMLLASGEQISIALLAMAIEKEVILAGSELKFDGHIENFDAFGDRTIFAKVISNENWTKLRDKVLGAVLNVAPGCTKKDKRPFTPHLTVANRDIPSGASVVALKVLNQLNLVEDFPVDNVAIFERRGGKWNVAWCGEM